MFFTWSKSVCSFYVNRELGGIKDGTMYIEQSITCTMGQLVCVCSIGGGSAYRKKEEGQALLNYARVHLTKSRGRILGRNWDKTFRSFLLAIHSNLY